MDAFKSNTGELEWQEAHDDPADPVEPNPAVPLNGNARRKSAVNWGADAGNRTPAKPTWAREGESNDMREPDMDSFLDDIDSLRQELKDDPLATVQSAPPVVPRTADGPAPTPAAALSADEIATPVLLYTARAIVFGQLVTNKNLLPGRLLLGVHVPEFLSLRDARRVPIHAGRPGQPQPFGEAHVPSGEIIAFHLMPPHHEPPDYVLAEPNRVMRPVTAFAGDFHFNGHLRMAAQSSVRMYLESAKSTFVSLYETTIANPSAPDMQALSVPAALVRRAAVAFGVAS